MKLEDLSIKKASDIELLSKILHSRNQVHIFHVQAFPSEHYAEHITLGDYYSSIGDLWDNLIEQLQGKNRKLFKGFKTYPLEDYISCQQLVKYFEDLNKDIADKRNLYQGSEIQNTIDEIVSLVNSTLYKLNYNYK